MTMAKRKLFEEQYPVLHSLGLEMNASAPVPAALQRNNGLSPVEKHKQDNVDPPKCKKIMFGRVSQTVHRSQKEDTSSATHDQNSPTSALLGVGISQSCEGSWNDPVNSTSYLMENMLNKNTGNQLGIICSGLVQRQHGRLHPPVKDVRGKLSLQDLPHPSKLRIKNKKKMDMISKKENILRQENGADVGKHLAQLKRKQSVWTGNVGSQLKDARQKFLSQIYHHKKGSTVYNSDSNDSNLRRATPLNHSPSYISSIDNTYYSDLRSIPQLSAGKIPGATAKEIKTTDCPSPFDCHQLSFPLQSWLEPWKVPIDGLQMVPKTPTVSFSSSAVNTPNPEEAAEVPHTFFDEASFWQSDIHKGRSFIEAPEHPHSMNAACTSVPDLSDDSPVQDCASPWS